MLNAFDNLAIFVTVVATLVLMISAFAGLPFNQFLGFASMWCWVYLNGRFGK